MPRLTDTVDELVEGTTSVTVLPLETTVVGTRLVVAGGSDVSGVFGGAMSAFDSAGCDGPAEFGLFGGAGGPGTSALVVTTALVAVAGAGTEVVGPALAGGAFVVPSVPAAGFGGAISAGCCTVVVDAWLLGGCAGTLGGGLGTAGEDSLLTCGSSGC